MRSGSSLTGALISMHPEVFHIFEPLCSLRLAFVNGRRLGDDEASRNNVTMDDEMFRARSIHMIQAILDCELNKLDKETLLQRHMKRSPSSIDYFKCIYPTNRFYGVLQEELIRKLPTCLPPLVHKCHQATVTSVKVIEVNMRQAHTLMSSDDRVKILHLLRDPRGVISSRQVFGIPESRDPRYVTDLCAQIHEDVLASKRLSRMFPGRILTVRYEDIVRSPVAATKELYRFVGVHLTPQIETKIWEMTYGGLNDGCNVCPTRKNATVTANRWRQKLTYETVSRVQEECGAIMSAMGYQSFGNVQELLNDGFPSAREDYDGGLMKVKVEDDGVR